jgi:hypothetical protein
MILSLERGREETSRFTIFKKGTYVLVLLVDVAREVGERYLFSADEAWPSQLSRLTISRNVKQRMLELQVLGLLIPKNDLRAVLTL